LLGVVAGSAGIEAEAVVNGLVIAVFVLLYADVIAAPTLANWPFTELAVLDRD
jgi:hypothetical protein